MKTASALVLALALLPAGAHAQDAATALQRAERAYDRLHTLRADFLQVLINPMLGGPDTTHGTLYLAPPDGFAMRFSDPAGDRIVTDGRWLWAYTPSSAPGQVIRQPVPENGTNTPNIFAQFVEHPLQRYAASYAGVDVVAGDTVDVVKLTPVVEGLPFRSATIAVSRQSGMLRRVDLVETSGQRRRLVLARLFPNVAIPSTEFTFEVPHGVKVVTP